ncbi:MAG TPA: LPS export ABC transporter periplasmic protein LptC [Vicinamibacterales bacterium]|nr:LPS export ABC transporter periplasmic protein LptC [Vicinamibacterales bacterium]
MTRWQRRARLIVAVFGVLFAAFVARQLRPRDPPPGQSPVHKTDPAAIIETTNGVLQSFTQSREGVHVTFQKQSVYNDGTSRLQGVAIVTTERNGSRTFTITGKEGQIGANQSSLVLDGDVRLAGSDGMTAATEHATYSDAEAVVRAPGPVDFGRNRMNGTGVGMTWDKNSDVLTILDQAIVHVAPDEHGAGAAEITAGTVAFARRDRFMRFERNVRIQRSGQVIEAVSAVAYLSEDEKRIETIDLHDQTRITVSNAAAGAVQALTGQQMNLKYGDDGETLQHALIAGDAVIQVAGDPGQQGRQITANTLDVALAGDGVTPTALVGRQNVLLTLPPEDDLPTRTVRAVSLDATGEAGKGLTRAQFSGGVQYRERSSTVGRGANSNDLDMALEGGMGAIREARFLHAVRFVDGSLTALAADATYNVQNGTVALRGAEPDRANPHVENEKIVVDATTVDMTLEGPKMKASGNVRSTLQPPPPPKPGEAPDVKMPAMLKQDQPVQVLAASMDYDGAISKVSYTGAARLFQSDTSIKGEAITLDNKLGNMTASGNVTTTTVLETTTSAKDTKGGDAGAKGGDASARGGEAGKDKDTTVTKDRSPSIATAKDLKYEDATRHLIYTGNAHMSGPEGDMTAARIELYLKPSGDELERAEAYENMTLREQNRETKGSKLIYTPDNETYVITGAPVKIVDQCQRETVGRTLTFNKGTDSVVVDGNSQIRTQTKGGNGKCS